jgi:hypothetical protein
MSEPAARKIFAASFPTPDGGGRAAGAIGGALPDLEHVLPVPGRGGRPVFPTHATSRLHGSLPVRFRAGTVAQLVLAAGLLAAALAAPAASKRQKRASPG